MTGEGGFTSGIYRLERVSDENGDALRTAFGNGVLDDSSIVDEPCDMEQYLPYMIESNLKNFAYDFIVYINGVAIGFISSTDLISRGGFKNMIVKEYHKTFVSRSAVTIAIGLQPSYRHAGHGTAILNVFANWLEKNWAILKVPFNRVPHPSPTYLFMTAKSTNIASIKLFKRCGFEIQEGATVEGVVLLSRKIQC